MAVKTECVYNGASKQFVVDNARFTLFNIYVIWPSGVTRQFIVFFIVQPLLVNNDITLFSAFLAVLLFADKALFELRRSKNTPNPSPGLMS